MLYTYKKLSSIMKEMERKSQSGRLKPEEAAIGIAAAYAIDLMDISKEIGMPLDLTVHTSDHLEEGIMRAHIRNMAKGQSIEESREILAKMLAGYETFTLINDFGCLENTNKKKMIDITFLNSVIMPKPKMILETMPDAEGVMHRVDVYDIARESMKSIRLGDPRKGDGTFFAGSLQPFYQRINKELIYFLEEIGKSEADNN